MQRKPNWPNRTIANFLAQSSRYLELAPPARPVASRPARSLCTLLVAGTFGALVGGTAFASESPPADAGAPLGQSMERTAEEAAGNPAAQHLTSLYR